MKARLGLVAIGILVGLVARWAVGTTDDGKRKYSVAPDQVPSKVKPDDLERIEIDLPIKDSLVPPIEIPGLLPPESSQKPLDYEAFVSVFDRHAHDEGAIFEAHGEQVCASGCAASRHPTAELAEDQFRMLMADYARQPMSEASRALEELLFYGPQTQKLINEIGYLNLDRTRAKFLRDELQRSHALISIRVIDEAGKVRSWLKPTRVPFDRRHVFEMEHKDLQPLVTSGTVKRVGLKHMWTRL